MKGELLCDSKFEGRDALNNNKSFNNVKHFFICGKPMQNNANDVLNYYSDFIDEQLNNASKELSYKSTTNYKLKSESLTQDNKEPYSFHKKYTPNFSYDKSLFYQNQCLMTYYRKVNNYFSMQFYNKYNNKGGDLFYDKIHCRNDKGEKWGSSVSVDYSDNCVKTAGDLYVRNTSDAEEKVQKDESEITNALNSAFKSNTDSSENHNVTQAIFDKENSENSNPNLSQSVTDTQNSAHKISVDSRGNKAPFIQRNNNKICFKSYRRKYYPNCWLCYNCGNKNFPFRTKCNLCREIREKCSLVVI